MPTHFLVQFCNYQASGTDRLEMLFEFEDCGEHCCLWECSSVGLDRHFHHVCLSLPICKVLVVHWPNGIHCYLRPGTSAYQKIQQMPCKPTAVHGLSIMQMSHDRVS